MSRVQRLARKIIGKNGWLTEVLMVEQGGQRVTEWLTVKRNSITNVSMVGFGAHAPPSTQ